MIIKDDHKKRSTNILNKKRSTTILTKKYHQTWSANTIIIHDHQKRSTKIPIKIYHETLSATMIVKNDNQKNINKNTHQKVASQIVSKHDHHIKKGQQKYSTKIIIKNRQQT